MTAPLAFGYCQARLQARFARLPETSDWARLDGGRTLAAALEEARAGRLGPWVEGLGGAMEGAEVERRLRMFAADRVEEIAAWVPAPWHAAVAWWVWLPYLPLLGYLSATAGPYAGSWGPPPGWAAADARLRPLLDAAGHPDPGAPRRAGRAWPATPGQDPATAWVEGWRGRWPACRGDGHHDLEALVARCAAHLDRFRAATPESAWGLRAALRERLRLDFRRLPLAPVTVFIYLALVFLDLERLRAELLRRALFPPPPC